ncbi:MAG: TerC family protein [Proteobacteria bacterium]|nr:TerC family protein [Pseudomonadota bacterium]
MTDAPVQDLHPYLFPGFIALVVSLIALDLFVMRKKDEIPTMKQATIWCLFWIGVAMTFNGWIAWYLGKTAALTFLTGYVIELSLSVDNLFVFILIFSSFKVDPRYQHRVLFWGILGALIMRAICIFAGVAALKQFEWLEFVFAAILVWAGIKTLLHKDEDDDRDPSQGFVATTIKKFIPVKAEFHGDRFIVIENGKKVATPLFLVLVLVELSDVIFAVDSIPAVLAVTKDPFLVYSSNIFAILGLRSLYFVLSKMVHTFRFLDTGVSLILIFIGIKMAASHWYHLPIEVALGVILGTLAISIVASLAFPSEEKV